MVAEGANLGVAFLAGVVSFVSPCCLPLVPTYVTYLTGASAGELARGMSGAVRRRLLLNALAFVLGFSLVFVLLGMTASGVGRLLRAHMPLVRQVSGIVVVAFGLYMMGFFNLDFLEREARPQVRPGRAGPINSLLLGAAFSAGWTPCVGPVLAAVLLLAGQAETALAGGLLLAVYSLGLAIPFLLTALGVSWFMARLPRLGRYLPAVRVASGALLVAVGLMLFFNVFGTLGRYFNWAQALGL